MMAGKFRTAAYAFIEELEEIAANQGWRIKRTTTGETEGGAGTVSMTFVQALDGDDALSGTPLGGAVNGHRTPEQSAAYDEAQRHVTAEVERVKGSALGFAAPRVHRPGAEARE